MRITTAIPAIVMAVVTGFSSAAALAGDNYEDSQVKIKSKKIETTRIERDRDWADNERWDRGEWTEGRRATVYTQREPRARIARREYISAREFEPGMTARRDMSGPYRYFFTDAEGKYNYYLDHYGYPYQYGGREMALPVDVFGYVPPEEVGGGPVLYYRDERPVSWSIFDEMGR